MKAIIIEGHDGFKAYIFPEGVKAFGVDPGPRFWISADGKDYSTAVRVNDHLQQCMEIMDEYRGHKPVEGVK